MPFLDTDPVTPKIVGVWYTSRFDPVFHNRQDVEMVRLRPDGTVQHRMHHVQLLGQGVPVPQQDNHLQRVPE